MPKRVQLVRHEPLVAASFLGRQGELTVELQTNTVRLHDGSTPGGFLLLTQGQANTLYQGKSNNLANLTSLTGTGLMIKRANSIAALSVAAGSHISVTNGDGQADGNIEVAVSTGTEDANVATIAQLKSILPAWLNSVTTSKALWPLKMAGIWRYPLADLPTGFEVVAGFQGRFLKGADGDDETNSTFEDNTTGGSGTQSLASVGGTSEDGGHNHTGYTGYHQLTIGEMPAHTHSYTIANYANVRGDGGSGAAITASSTSTGSAGSNGSHRHTIFTDGAHTHDLTGTVVIDPPWLAVYLVERTS